MDTLGASPPGEQQSPLNHRLASVRDEFEAAWNRGERPQIEVWLEQHAALRRAELLPVLLHVELAIRHARGESVVLDDYFRRFPADAAEVSRVVGTFLASTPTCLVESPGEATTDSCVRMLSTMNEAELQGQPSAAATSTSPRPILMAVGRYQICAILGRGSFGTVYRGWDPLLKRPVAIKIANAEYVASPEQRRQFLEEAQMAARLNHPGIVVVYDSGAVDNGPCYIVSELVDGTTLRRKLAAGRLSHDAAVDLTLQMAEALDAAHRESIVHRDLKPENVLVDAAGRARVTDFGLAVDERTQRALCGEVAGTMAYMAPEQLRGDAHHLDGRADIWALGVMLYEMLAGRRPFTPDENGDFTADILNRDARSPRQFDRSIPRELERICLHCLDRNLSQRCQSAAELIEDLVAYRDTQRPPSATTITVPAGNTPVATPARSRTAGIIAVALGVSLAVFAGLWWAGTLVPSAKEPQSGLLAQMPFGTWIDLLPQTPHKIVWHDENSKLLTDDNTLWISSRLRAVLQLGIAPSNSFQFRTTLHQNPWGSGDVGIFYGLHDAPDKPGHVLYQVLVLEPKNRFPNRVELIWWRATILQAKGGRQTIRHTQYIHSQEVENPGVNERELDFEVRNGRLVSVRFGTENLDKLLDLGPDSPSASGPFGVFLYGCTTELKHPKVRFFEDGPRLFP